MFSDKISVMWLAVSVSIIAVEIYVPYKKMLFMSFCISAYTAFIASLYGIGIFYCSMMFLFLSVTLYILGKLLSSAFKRKKKEQYISLCDIPPLSTGYVMSTDGSIIKVKNGSFDKTAKGTAADADFFERAEKDNDI